MAVFVILLLSVGFASGFVACSLLCDRHDPERCAIEADRRRRQELDRAWRTV